MTRWPAAPRGTTFGAVFSTCLFCHASLGANDAVEHFPVGRRLAFDAAKGRLWAVCGHCARWNLSPLEERWEAIEECERLFRSRRLRAQTAEIGLARLPDGTDLVRVGAPLRPEFAAWRYGDEFGRRRRRHLLWGTSAVAALGAAYVGGVAAGMSVAFPMMFLPHLFGVLKATWYEPPESAEVKRGPGRSWKVSGDASTLVPDDHSGWRLVVRHHFGQVELDGDPARRMLGVLLAQFNEHGGPPRMVQAAAGILADRPTPEAFIRESAARAAEIYAEDAERQKAWWAANRYRNTRETAPPNRGGIANFDAERRLALEMALHEESERRALAGELAPLVAAWREAEEVAAIADALLLPAGVEEGVAHLRERARPRNGETSG